MDRFCDPGHNGIFVDITQQNRQIDVIQNNERLESALEYITCLSVSLVEIVGVGHIDLPEDRSQRSRLPKDEQMDMVRHKAIGAQEGPVTPEPLAQHFQVHPAIGLRIKKRFPSLSSTDRVVPMIRNINPRHPRHESIHSNQPPHCQLAI